MYFTGTVKIDPSQSTIIDTQEPDGFFGKLLHAVSGKRIGEKTEQETFTAVSILQTIYSILKDLKIRNVVKLTQDDTVFYHDDQDKDDDLDEAIMRYELDGDELLSEFFTSLSMTLEHLYEGIACLIKIVVRKNHAPGEYPIEIRIKGLINVDEMVNDPPQPSRLIVMGERNEARSAEAQRQSTNPQEIIKQRIREKGDSFVHFLNLIDFTFRRHMSIDDVETQHDVNLVVGKEDFSALAAQAQKGVDARRTKRNPESSLKDIFGDMSFALDHMDRVIQDSFTAESQHFSGGKKVETVRYYSRSVSYSTGDAENTTVETSGDAIPAWVIPLMRRSSDRGKR